MATPLVPCPTLYVELFNKGPDVLYVCIGMYVCAQTFTIPLC